MPMGMRRPPELHAVLIWNASQLGLARRFIERWITAPKPHSASGLRIANASELRLPKEARRAMCKAVYVSRKDVAWHKGCAPFGEAVGLLLIHDSHPVYGWRSSVRASQNLNVHMKALKDALRDHLHEQLPAVAGPKLVHSSVNAEEALLVLRHAGLGALALKDRPQFDTFAAFFEALDSFAPFKYVVHRSHLALEHAEAGRNLGVYARGSKDVDLLVNDYYFFKAISGAQSTDRVHMREQNSAGHIQNTVLIGGREVRMDVRYVGDGYVDATWASDILKRRQRHLFLRIDGTEASFHVPRPDDYFNLLLYHCLLQKRTATNLKDKLYKYLVPMALLAGVRAPPPTLDELTTKAPRLWDLLEAFLGARRYTLACPTDPTVVLQPWRKSEIDRPFMCGGVRCGPSAEKSISKGKKRLRQCVRPASSGHAATFCFRGSTFYCPTDEKPDYRRALPKHRKQSGCHR